ncbi:MAG TPA: hypothetical protein VFQ44_17195 [Streptosporangiaceae bacterium]|nr:hypothetical protein [Streptosporangiaceae bacterium]
MTRGQERNEVYAYPAAQEPAESVIGQGPAPEPEIARQLDIEARDGIAPAELADERDPIAILAPVVRRDDSHWSGTETKEHALATPAAELAGLDGTEVIRQGIEGRPFTGARSHSAVLRRAYPQENRPSAAEDPEVVDGAQAHL